MDLLDHLPGMPTRYSYEMLKKMTENFSRKLGQGGFGSVYEGILDNGTKIAVKYLDGFGQVKDSFLVEANTIGSIHHINLVKLVGYCSEKSHRLLVYEYMANGSLDTWIFGGTEKSPLPWHTRRKIILDIAKGLAYLHEECCQKIIHFDVKPQNVLLDQNFNAKVSDFGLSKLLEKDQSRVVTRMRGTPGYLAPEWLHSGITEKVDVYSFGVVIMEIICGRKNVDWSMTGENSHLLSLFKRKALEERLQDIVDKKSEDMLIHMEEAIDVMKIGAWCLQSDFTKRPSMSLVVKALEGVVAAETKLNFDFTNSSVVNMVATADQEQEAVDDASPLLPSVLSGPRVTMLVDLQCQWWLRSWRVLWILKQIWIMALKDQASPPRAYHKLAQKNSMITKKVDVYSFGVMVLEILCSRKNLDRCQSEDDAHLLGLFKRKAENGELLDLVDKDNKDMQLHGSLVVEIMIRLLHGACKVITG
ncbi:unnamed protein product [Coffea canephora]|uniref:non-specific serine/threonine protein kinase n=1 Tax=Coffea canephora TaxID=49390 RepID=A0A068V5Q0_COFCA|nr:unnamed protein product [Coffea canephora]